MLLAENNVTPEVQHAFTLFTGLCLHQGMRENVLFSPYSMQQTLSLLAVNTKNKHILNELSLYNSTNMLDESLCNTKSGTLILLNKKHQPYRVYKEKGTVELFSSPEDGCQKLVSFQQHLLGEVLNRTSPQKEADMSLFSALRYAARWCTPFSKNNTGPQKFYKTNGTATKSVTTMQSEFSHAYGKITKDYEVAALPGENQSITYFVKPKTNKEHILHELYDICNHDNELRNTIDLQMPKLSLTSTSHLLPSLRLMGLTHLAASHADKDNYFTMDNIVDPLRTKINLNNIDQTVRLSLDEERAEVKAITSTSFLITTIGIPPQPLIIKMDAPYFVVIKDKTSEGLTRIVCTAWINSPTT